MPERGLNANRQVRNFARHLWFGNNLSRAICTTCAGTRDFRVQFSRCLLRLPEQLDRSGAREEPDDCATYGVYQEY